MADILVHVGIVSMTFFQDVTALILDPCKIPAAGHMDGVLDLQAVSN